MAEHNVANVQQQDGSWELGGTVNFLSTGETQVDGVAVTPADAMVGVTASAAEINLIDGSIAGTSVASKALALGASKETDTLVITGAFTTQGNTALGNAAGDTFKVHGTAGSGAQSAFLADAAAGGTGATAGAYDTAQHRDDMIALVNAMKACLVNHGLMAAS